MKEIKVLVVDDSALMRKIVSDMINEEKDMEVVDTAKNGEDLFKKLDKKPDVITLDVEMPILNGIDALKRLKSSNCDIPVIMLSSLSKRGTELTMECLESGAFDFIAKPSGAISLDINKVKEDVVEKIRIAYSKFGKKTDHIQCSCISNKKEIPVNVNANMNSNVNRSPQPKINMRGKRVDQKINAVVIGASTGGPKALYEVITRLPELNIPVFVVQHMPSGFTKAFSERLNLNSKLKVVEVEDNMAIEKNTVYIAKGGYHMEVGVDKRIHLNLQPSIWGVRPAVDKLFISASSVYKENLLSVILTGMGRDGAEGTSIVKDSGGITISQDENTCTIYGMPKAAFETGKVDEVLPLSYIADRISNIVLKRGV